MDLNEFEWSFNVILQYNKNPSNWLEWTAPSTGLLKHMA